MSIVIIHGILNNRSVERKEKYDPPPPSFSFNRVNSTTQAWLRCMNDPLVPTDSYIRAVDAGLVYVGGNVGQAREEALRTMLALPPPNR